MLDPRFQGRGPPETTYEKLSLQLDIFDEVVSIRHKLADLSRIERQLARRDLYEKMETVDDAVLHLLSRAITLASPRGVNVRGLTQNPPKLKIDEEGKVQYEDWYDWTLKWLQIIIRILDEAQLLLTEQPMQPDWITPIISEAREEDWKDVEEGASVSTDNPPQGEN